MSLKGKVTVANALLVSLLQYPTSVTFTPERVAKEYRSIITHFLWDGKKPKIAYSSIIQTIDRGGLKLMDLPTRIQVNQLQWVRRLIKTPDMNAGNALRYILGVDNLGRFLSYRSPSYTTSAANFCFYHEMLKTWQRYRKFEPENENAIRRESLWFNHLLGPGLEHISRRGWQDKGIETVGDLCHQSENRLLSHTEISDKFGIVCTFLEALSLRASIPLKWRRALTQDWTDNSRGPGI